jgi:hypothetical protein
LVKSNKTKPLKKLIWVLLAFIGCTAPKSLHQSGTYMIASVKGDIVTFRGVSGSYQLPVDTLKIGDTIRMNVIHMARNPKK